MVSLVLGFRQGCPLYLLLLSLVTDALSVLISAEVSRGNIKLTRAVQRNNSNIEHLFDADDLLVVYNADVHSVSSISRVFAEFESISGLGVNTDKSVVVFSKAVRRKSLSAKTQYEKHARDRASGEELPTWLGKTHNEGACLRATSWTYLTMIREVWLMVEDKVQSLPYRLSP